MSKITPFLWFNDQAEAAMRFYVSVFRNSKITSISYYGEGTPAPPGSVMTVSGLIEGQEFVAMNGGPHYTINPAISFMVNCDTQREIDSYWKKLSDGGQELPCGWLTDRFGVSWQVTPRALMKLIHDPDPERKQRVLNAMYRMTKIDLAEILRAAGPEPRRTTAKRTTAKGTAATRAAATRNATDRYLAAAPVAQRAALAKLRRDIQAAAPQAEECISYSLPAFRLDGRPIVAFGSARKHCSFYPMSAALIASLGKELARYDVSKGTIRFSPEEPLPATLVRKIVRARIAENRAKAKR